MRDQSLDQDIDQGEYDLYEEQEIKKTQCGAEMTENEPECTCYRGQDITAVLLDYPDAPVVEDHLDEQKQEINDSAENQSPVKWSDLGESCLSHAAQNGIKGALHTLGDYQEKNPRDPGYNG